ncbi:hypothetical protein F5H01DRAFT_410550 [Linnemannia elongata]|nr:hypothetical protein F5H01DRAFT_410550 [Linnemannia elongata]
MSLCAVAPPPKQQVQAQNIYQECSSAIGTDEFEMPLGPGTSKTTEEEEEECLLSGLRGGGGGGGEGVCSSSWDAYYPLTVDESRTMNQRKEASGDVSRGQEMEQDVMDSLLYSEEYLPSGERFGGAGQQVLPQSLQPEEEFEQGSEDDGFCFGAYETDSSEDVMVWSPEQAVPDSTIPLPDGSSDEWIHESYLDDRTTSEGGASGGSFEWGSTGPTVSPNGSEIYGSQGWQDGYSDESSSSESVWKRSTWKDIETSQQTFQDQQEQQQRLCDDYEDGSVLDVKQGMDGDLFAATKMTTDGLLERADPHKRLCTTSHINNNVPTSFTLSIINFNLNATTTTATTTTTPTIEDITIRKTSNTSSINNIKGNRVRVHNRTVTRLDPRTVGKASETRMDAVVYDQEVGVIRRWKMRAPEAVAEPDGGDDVGAVGQSEDGEIEQIAREEEEGEGGEETLKIMSSGKRRKVADGSEAKGGAKRKRVLHDIFDASTTTKSPIPPPSPPPVSPLSPPFTQRSVYGSSRTSRILRATELIHENVSKDTISSKRDMFYRDVMAFGSQIAVNGIVEDLACTFEVPRSNLNVVAGTRSVVFGSVRMLVKALGRQKCVAVGDNGGEDSGVSEQLLWLKEEIANSPFSKTQKLLNNDKTKEQREGEEGEEEDPLDSRFSQTSYNTLVPIPIRFSDIVEIEIHPRTRFVLVVEKEATLSNLISLGFCETNGPCILLTSKGFPDLVARQLLKALSEMVLDGVYLRRFPSTPLGLGDGYNDSGTVKSKSSAEVLGSCQSTFQPPPLEIPLVALMDCDPYGIEIYLTYRCGSIKSAYENAKLAVPALKCLGQFPSDWDLFLDSQPIDAFSDGEPPQGQEQEGCNDEEQETMRLRARFKEMLIPLTVKDRTKLERLITTHPYICQHARWRDQIAKMLEADAKTEIQSLHQLDCSSAGSGVSVAVGVSEGESGGRGNVEGAEEGGELLSSSSSALVLYLQRKLQDPKSWL